MFSNPLVLGNFSVISLSHPRPGGDPRSIHDVPVLCLRFPPESKPNPVEINAFPPPLKVEYLSGLNILSGQLQSWTTSEAQLRVDNLCILNRLFTRRKSLKHVIARHRVCSGMWVRVLLEQGFTSSHTIP